MQEGEPTTDTIRTHLSAVLDDIMTSVRRRRETFWTSTLAAVLGAIAAYVWLASVIETLLGAAAGLVAFLFWVGGSAVLRAIQRHRNQRKAVAFFNSPQQAAIRRQIEATERGRHRAERLALLSKRIATLENTIEAIAGALELAPTVPERVANRLAYPSLTGRSGYEETVPIIAAAKTADIDLPRADIFDPLPFEGEPGLEWFQIRQGVSPEAQEPNRLWRRDQCRRFAAWSVAIIPELQEGAARLEQQLVALRLELRRVEGGG